MLIILFILLSFFNSIYSYLHLPFDHLEFYFKNNPKDYYKFCSKINQQVNRFNCSKSINEFKCWGYENDKRCKKWNNKYPIKPCKF